MKYVKILISIALMLCFTIQKVLAQLKSEVQTSGIIFNGTKSLAELKSYDLMHPELKNKKYTEAEPEEEENEEVYELNKRVSGIRDENIRPTQGTPRANALRKTGGAQQNNLRQEALTYCSDFQSLPTNGTSFPPDVHGATGFDHLVTTLNTEVRIQTKTGNTVSTVSLVSFWSATGQTDVFDPRIVYDQLSNRWITMACCARRSASSGMVLAASQTPDPTGNWNFYTIDADPADTLWFDYGSMGFSNDKICIAGNMFNNIDAKNGDGGRLFTINKSNVLNGSAIGAITRTRGVAFTTCPALSFDNTSTCYALAVWNDEAATLRFYSITGSAASATITDNGIVDYGSGNGWKGGLNNILPQSGSAIKINGGDDRMQSVIYRNGKVFWTNNFYLPLNNPTYCGIQYGSFTASTRATINFAGLWNDTGDEMFCFPSIAVNANEDVGVAFSYFSKTAFPSAAVAFGGSNLSLTYAIVKSGEAPYTFGFPAGDDIRYRWGDYMSVSVDPTDDRGMWSLSQYSRAPGNSNWGTWWAKLCPATCIANLSLSGTMVANTVKKFEVTNTITSTAIINPGAFIKYDVGSAVIMSPGFVAQAGSNYRAFVEGCGGSQ